MKLEIELGSVPCDENCAQVGSEHYELMARAECERWIKTLRTVIGPEPEGARLRIKSFPHDFGSYYEVVCTVSDDRNAEAVAYAFRCDSEAPTKWIPLGWDYRVETTQIPLLE